MLGIKNNDEIITGMYADTLYDEYQKRYGEPSLKGMANQSL